MSTSHAGMVVHFDHLLERRYQGGFLLGKFSMAYCPQIGWDVCKGFEGYLKWEVPERYRTMKYGGFLF